MAQACAALKEKGARAVPLAVSAPFHSSLMLPAEKRLADDLATLNFAAPALPVYVNVDAAPLQDADAARDALVRQVSRPVRWEQSVLRMVEDGVKLFVEIGAGKVLTGLGRRIAKEIPRVNVATPEDIAPAKAAIAEARG